MPVTARSGITYTDYWEGHSVNFRFEVQEATRVVQVQRNNLELFIIDMLGESVLTGETGITRFPPERHPRWPWLLCMEAMELPVALDVPGDSGPNQSISYGTNDQGLTRVQLVYRTLDWVAVDNEAVSGEADPELQRYVSRYETYATEALPIPGNSFKFVVDNVVIPEAGSLYGFTKEVTYVWHQVPKYSKDHVESYVGNVNSTEFDAHPATFTDPGATWPARQGYDAETLLFLTPDVKLTWTSAGHLAYEIAYKFLFRPDGWNKLYRKTGASGPGFYAIIAADGGGTKLYPAQDFHDLFQLV